jgi:hypothetical protein
MAKFGKSKVETEENKNEEVVEKTTKVEEPKVEQPKVEEPKVENEKAKEVTKVVKPESLADFLF